MTLKEAVGKVLEGWTLPNAVRKILEEAYFAEPQRPWVGLTPEEVKEISLANRPYVVDMVVALEARLKEKNHGT